MQRFLGVLCALVVTSIVAMPQSGWTQMLKKANTFSTASKASTQGFRVDMRPPGGAGQEDTRWESATGGSLQILPAVSAAGTDRFRHAPSAGTKRVEELTLRGPVTASRNSVGDWFNAVLQGQQSGKRAVTLTPIQADGSDGDAWTYVDAIPVRYVFPEVDASKSGALYESLVIQADGAQSTSGITTRAPLRPAKAPRASTTDVLDGNFRVDGFGGEILVQSLSIDDLVIPAVETRTSRDGGYQTYQPGAPQYGSMTLRARASDSSELAEWFTEVANGEQQRRDVSLILLRRDGGEGRRYDFKDCMPTAYDPGDFGPGSSGVETLTMSIGRIEFN